MQIRKLCCTCMRAQAVSRLIFLKIYVNCILQCTGNLVAALYLQMWEGSQISIDKSKPKRYVSVLVCSTAGSGKSFKGLGLGSAHLKSKTLKSERIRGRSKRKGSWKKIEILNQELNFSRLLLPVRRSVVRAWGEKKALLIPIYGDINHDRVISQSCLLPQCFCKFSLCFCAAWGPCSTGRIHVSSHSCSYWCGAEQTAGATQLQLMQMVPLEHHLAESKMSVPGETIKHGVSSKNGPNIILVFISVFFSVNVAPLWWKW